MNIRFGILFSFVVAIALARPSYAQTNVVPDDTEFQALKALWDNAGGSTWTTKTNWPAVGSWPTTATAAQMATWYGVTVTNGDITTLSLPANNLTGTIPAQIGNLTKLTILSLNGNSLSGSIPTEIGNLNKLSTLYLHTNQLSGAIPTTLGNLSLLRLFNLANNQLTGSIPQELCGMTSVWMVNLSNNHLTGSIPACVGNMNTLTQLFVNVNQLSGSLPANLGNIASLGYFYCNDNQLSGPLPASFSNSNLQYFNAASNQFSGPLPAMPNMKNAVLFWIQSNQFSGPLPTTLFDGWTKVTNINISSNPLTGAVPAGLGTCTALTTFFMMNTSISSLPPSILNLPVLRSVAFAGSELTSFPDFSQHVNKAALQIDVSNNRLDFSHIEPVVGTLNIFTYKPQKAINDVVTQSAALGADLVLTARPKGAFTSNLKWEKQPTGSTTWTDISSTNADPLTGNTYRIANVATTASAKYRWSATSTKATGFTLTSSPIDVAVCPALYTLAGGGTYCGTVPSVTLTLSGSQAGVTYQLQLNGANSGTAVAGTNASLQWTGITATGTYTVIATSASGCAKTMTGTAAINQLPVPQMFTLTMPAPYCAGTSGATLSLSGSQVGVQYQVLVDEQVVATTAGTGSPLSWQVAQPGVAVVRAVLPSGCESYMSGPATIALIPTPAATISGPDMFEGSSITLTAPAGYSYTWSMAGAGVMQQSNANTLAVTAPGDYQVTVNSSGCMATSAIHRISRFVRPNFNGSISAMRWRAEKPYATNGSDLTGIYLFDYDAKNQLKKAQWGEMMGTAVRYGGNRFAVNNLNYDANGNILTLNRYDGTASLIHNFTYQYNAGATSSTQRTNQLQSIGGHAAYSYNAIGQMTGEDKVTGDDQYVDYDVSGKVTAVYSNADKSLASLKVAYTYDDRGFRLTKTNYETSRVTWYIRDGSGNVLSIYETDLTTGATNPTEVPVYGSGKLGTYYPQPDQIGAMAYELTDHLGNVRAILQDKENVYTATMEDNGQAEVSNPRVTENYYFQNIFQTEVEDAHMNHSAPSAFVATPERSAYLFWNDNAGTQAVDKAIGPAIALKVDAGDELTMEAYARYQEQVSYTRNVDLTLLSTLLGNTFVGTVGVDNAATLTGLFQNGLGAAGLLAPNGDNTRPFAYLNYMLFNEQRQFVDAGAWRVDSDGAFAAGQEALHNFDHVGGQTITVAHKGYVYVWVSNESNGARVWFDDVKVTHKQGIVTQATDYDPWGVVSREAKTDDQMIYRYGYQGKYAEKDEETGWSHFELREFDPVIGRWISKDPQGQYFSPYIGMGNYPIGGTDPDGGYFFGLFGSTRAQRQAARVQADLTGGEIQNITSKNISVFATGLGYNDPTIGENSITSHFWNYTFDKKGNYNVSIEEVTWSSFATGQIDFDPLGQYMLGSLAVQGTQGLAYGVLRVGVSSLSVSTAPGRAMFWSGMRTATAEGIANSYGLTTLEMTTAGRFLTKFGWMTGKKNQALLWDTVSGRFANAATGNVHVFLGSAFRGASSTFMRIEFPILRSSFYSGRVHFYSGFKF